MAGVEFMELRLIIAFEAARPLSGLHFCGPWVLSDNQVDCMSYVLLLLLGLGKLQMA